MATKYLKIPVNFIPQLTAQLRRHCSALFSNKHLLLVVAVLILTTKTYADSNIRFIDIVQVHDEIWALDESGSITRFLVASGERLPPLPSQPHDVKCITTDKRGNPVVANAQQQILRLNSSNQQWETIGHYTGSLFAIVVNSEDLCFALSSKGIQNTRTGKFYFKSSVSLVWFGGPHELPKPCCVYLDKKDIMWAGFDFGEFGGDLLAFETRKQSYIDFDKIKTPYKQGFYRFHSTPIRSFYEDSSSLHVVQSMRHLNLVETIITQIRNKTAKVVLHVENSPKFSDREPHWSKATICAGTAAFNEENNSVYLYTQHGIVRANTSKDLSKPDSWKNVVNTRLPFSEGKENHVGRMQNGAKLIVVNEHRFVLLVREKGIGFFGDSSVAFYSTLH